MGALQPTAAAPPKEAAMRTLFRWSVAAAAVVLAGCATYPYGYNGYGYDRPYYGYDTGPYAYRPYYYGYPTYPPYYYGAPSVGLSFGFSSGGHHHR